MLSKAVFLDKDGTLVEDVPYNVDPGRIRLSESALEGLSSLQGEGYRLIVVTNQSGVAHGYFKERDLGPVESQVRALLRQAEVYLTGFYYCPHYPGGTVRPYAVDCFCRKPRPGLIYRAAFEHKIDVAASWMVGDILHDIEAGNRAGCRTVLIDNRNETEWRLTSRRVPEFMAKNLYEAARIICRESRLERN